MKIKRRLKLNTFLSLAVVALMFFSLIWSFGMSYWAAKEEAMVIEIQRVAFERIILRDDWILHREDRASIQWFAKTETLRSLLDVAAKKITDKEIRELLENIRRDFEASDALLSKIIRNHRQENRVSEKKLFTGAESRIISQAFLRAYSLNDNIKKLHKHSHESLTAAHNKGMVLIVFFVLGGIIFMIFNSSMLNGIVTKRIATLNEGLGIIGSGDLNYRIPTAGDDELSDLARASNDMAAKLKQSYTSVENLRLEIASREQAESEKLRLLEIVDRSLNEVFVFDAATLQFEYANQSAMANLGYTLEEMKSLTPVDIKPQFSVEAFRKMIRPLVTDEKQYIVFETIHRRKDGTEYPVEVHLQFHRQATKRVFFSVIIDITERKLAEDKLCRLNEELEARVQKRTEELAAKNSELERLNHVFVDRELRMRELKEKIAELESRSS